MFQAGDRYRINAHIIDFSGNELLDIIEVVVGKPVITITLNPDEIKPYYQNRIPVSESQTQVKVKVTSPGGTLVKGYLVRLKARRVENSGGHDHENTEQGGPVGIFDLSEGLTNENGEFTTTYRASEFGGEERIITYYAFQEDSVYADLTVRIPGLDLLPDALGIYEKVGGTEHHYGPPDYAEDHNHYGTNDLIDAIYAIALNYVDQGGEIILINDIGLPYGGLFDINGNWTTPHQTHRIGENADVGGRGVGGRFIEMEIINQVYRLVSDAFGFYIPNWPNYERGRNHYHWTVRRR